MSLYRRLIFIFGIYRITRVRTTSRLCSGNNSRRLPSRRGTADGGKSPCMGKRNTFSPGKEAQVSAGGEQQNQRITGRETKSVENEIIAQAGHGYITQRDLTILRQH